MPGPGGGHGRPCGGHGGPGGMHGGPGGGHGGPGGMHGPPRRPMRHRPIFGGYWNRGPRYYGGRSGCLMPFVIIFVILVVAFLGFIY